MSVLRHLRRRKSYSLFQECQSLTHYYFLEYKKKSSDHKQMCHCFFKKKMFMPYIDELNRQRKQSLRSLWSINFRRSADLKSCQHVPAFQWLVEASGQHRRFLSHSSVCNRLVMSSLWSAASHCFCAGLDYPPPPSLTLRACAQHVILFKQHEGINVECSRNRYFQESMAKHTLFTSVLNKCLPRNDCTGECKYNSAIDCEEWNRTWMQTQPVTADVTEVED